MSDFKRRLRVLEKAIGAQDVCRQSQVVIYDLATGKPLNPPDPMAATQIWIPDDGRGLDRPQR